jgi:hypothetical protein
VGAIVRVSGAGTMFPRKEVSQPGAEILHFARELILLYCLLLGQCS